MKPQRRRIDRPAPLKPDAPTDVEIVHLRRRMSDFTGGPARRVNGRRQWMYWLRWQFPIFIVALGLVALSYDFRVRAATDSNRAARVAIINARKGCERGMQDRYSTMEAWYGAYLARKAQEATSVGPALTADTLAAADYRETVQDDLRRVDAAHSLTWPRHSKHHPFGFGHFSCVAVNPFPKPIVVHVWDILN